MWFVTEKTADVFKQFDISSHPCRHVSALYTIMKVDLKTSKGVSASAVMVKDVYSSS